MAQNNIWNPYEQSNYDPNNNQYNQQPQQNSQQTSEAGPTNVPTNTPAGGYDIDAWYQNYLGRGPDENERRTDLENIGKYGAEAFESDFRQKRSIGPSGPQPGQGVQPAQQTGFTPPDWYK
jgi:hypothetical protein